MHSLGLLPAVASALCNGTFSVLSKSSAIKSKNVSPHVFNFYASLGAALSGILAWVAVPKAFSFLALISGLLFTLAVSSSFVAIKLLDSVAVAAGIWCGVSMVISFIAGAATGEALRAPLAVTAMLLMIYAVYRITMTHLATGCAPNAIRRAYTTFAKISPPPGGGIVHKFTMKEEHSTHCSDRGFCRAEAGQTDAEAGMLEEQGSSKSIAIGIASAVMAGVFGGLILIPMKFSDIQGLEYLPSMGVGIAVALPCPLLLHFAMPVGLAGTSQHYAAAIPGIASGVIWNIGNACSMIAVKAVGLAVAYPIMQSGLFVAALWGMLLFNELPGTSARVKFLVDGCIVIVGVILLSLSVLNR